MNTATLASAASPLASLADNRPQLDNKPSRATIGLFVLLLVGGRACRPSRGHHAIRALEAS